MGGSTRGLLGRVGESDGKALGRPQLDGGGGGRVVVSEIKLGSSMLRGREYFGAGETFALLCDRSDGSTQLLAATLLSLFLLCIEILNELSPLFRRDANGKCMFSTGRCAQPIVEEGNLLLRIRLPHAWRLIRGVPSPLLLDAHL
jgi:hypothetical protein